MFLYLLFSGSVSPKNIGVFFIAEVPLREKMIMESTPDVPKLYTSLSLRTRLGGRDNMSETHNKYLPEV